MSVEKLNENEPEVASTVEAAPTVEAAIPEGHGQAAVLANLHTLGPGDSDLLAQRLRDFPELHDQILEWAMTHLGNDTVSRALAGTGKDAAKDGAKAATDDGFVQEQIEVMAAQKSDEEFVAFQLGVMAEDKKQSDDNQFVAEQMEVMAQEQGDKEFVAFQMGEMAKQAEDDAFVKDQIQEMDQAQGDKQFVAEQMGVMAQQADDKEFVQGQIEDMARQQSDEEFVAYQIGVMEAEQKAQGHEAPAEEAKVEAAAPEDAQLVDNVAAIPEAAPEMIGTALAENPALRAPILEQATKEQGVEVVTEAVKVEEQEQQQALVEPAAPVEEIQAPKVIEQELAAPQAVEEAWVQGARSYNQRHAELVAAFNELTNNQYALQDGSVSPEVIVAWQQANNVSVDGRIGPETIAAARGGGQKVPLADAVTAVQVEDEVPVADEP